MNGMNNNVEAESVMPGAMSGYAALTRPTRLKYIATINDESLTESTDADYELQYIDIGNVDSYGNVHDIVNYKFEAAPSRARRIVRDGDIIVSTVRTYLQAIASIENSPENLIVSTGFAVVRPFSTVFDPRFCKYALREKHFLWEIESRSTGVSYPAINASELADIRLSLPSVETQRLIADYLDRETARIDALVAEKEKMLALLEEKRSALISRAVTRGLNPDISLKPSNAPWFDETPFSWSVERLKWVIKSVTSGVSVNASDQPIDGDGFGILKTSAVAVGVFFPNENKSVWDTEYDRLACPVTKNTIIMSRMNTPNLVGESGYVAEDYPTLFLPDRLWQISFDENRVFVPFMSLLLASKEARHALSSMATGTSPSMKNLAIEEMSSLLIPVPPIDEQKLIYNAVARQNAMIGPLKNDLTASLQLLKERRAALITAAVTGRIPIEAMRS
jgi:type I restriction enzyme S subunit